MFAYTGGYTTPDRNGRGGGINVFRIDPATGAWAHRQHVGSLEDLSLFTFARDRTRLYCVHGARTPVSAFSIDPRDGRIDLLNQVDCGGTNPVDSALDPTERFLVAANYATGTVAVLPVREDGKLQPVRQFVPLLGAPWTGPEGAGLIASACGGIRSDRRIRCCAGQRARLYDYGV